MSTKTLLKTLPLNTLVCHDFFGLGTTTSIISNSTNRPEMAKVNVEFDDDVGTSCDDYTGRISSSKDADGTNTILRYRTILISYLDWDSEDETEKTIKIRKAKNDEPADAVDGIEALFDNPEMAEDDEDEDDCIVVKATEATTATDESDNNDDNEGFNTFMKEEFDG
jgi:hypothetical protein